MSGSSNAQTDIVWPGYVAAMASLLLSLLLVAAVLAVTISQIGSVNESYHQAIANIGFKSSLEVDRISRQAGISENTEAQEEQEAELSQNGRLSKVNPNRNFTERNKVNSRVVVDENLKIDALYIKKSLPVLDLSQAVFDPVAAREAANLVANDKALLAQIDLSKVDVSKIKFKGLDIAKIDLSRQITVSDMKKIDFSQVNLSALSATRVEILKPFMAKEAIRYQLQLQRQKIELSTQSNKVVPLLEASPVPAPDVVSVKQESDAPVSQPNKLQINYIEEAVEPLPAQRQQILQALTGLQRLNAGIRIWAQLPDESIYLKRTAYNRLMSVRALAVEAGFKSSLIQVDIVTVPNMALSQSYMVIYIAEQKR